MGVGFGKSAMLQSDIVLCTLNFYNISTDNFICTDRYGTTADTMPTIDTERNTVDVDTNTLVKYDSIRNTVKGTFEATFERLCDTEEITQDVILVPDSTINIIWAYGLMNSNTI